MVISTHSDFNIALLASIASKCKYSLSFCTLYFYAFITNLVTQCLSTHVTANSNSEIILIIINYFRIIIFLLLLLLRT